MWVPPHRSLKEINRELHTLPGAALALQVKGAIQRGRMKGKAERAARRFNHPLINKLRSEIRMVTPNDNWNLIWQKWHVHLIAIHSRMPTHTHSPPLPVCVCNYMEVPIVHRYPHHHRPCLCRTHCHCQQPCVFPHSHSIHCR